MSLPTRELSHAFGWSVGWAVNVAPAWAVGLDVGYAFGEGSRRRSVRARLRRWLHPRVAVDVVPGSSHCTRRPRSPTPVAWVAVLLVSLGVAPGGVR